MKRIATGPLSSSRHSKSSCFCNVMPVLLINQSWTIKSTRIRGWWHLFLIVALGFDKGGVATRLARWDIRPTEGKMPIPFKTSVTHSRRLYTQLTTLLPKQSLRVCSNSEWVCASKTPKRKDTFKDCTENAVVAAMYAALLAERSWHEDLFWVAKFLTESLRNIPAMFWLLGNCVQDKITLPMNFCSLC